MSGVCQHAGDLRARERARGRPECHLERLGAARGANTHALKAKVMAAAQIIECADDRFECLGEAFVEQRARINGHDLAGVDAVHAKTHAAVDNGRLELDFIAVAPVVLGTTDRLHQLIDLIGAELADALERGAQVLLLGGKLRGAREIAPRAAAANTHEGAGRLDAIGARLQNLGGAGAHKRLAVLHDLGLDGVACHGALDKDGLAVVGVRQPVGAVRHRFYGELHIPACHSRCCPHHGSREKRPASEAFLKCGALLQTSIWSCR